MTMIEMKPEMIDSLQLALTAHEVYQMTDDAAVIKTAYSALSQLAEMIKQAHGVQALHPVPVTTAAQGAAVAVA